MVSIPLISLKPTVLTFIDSLCIFANPILQHYSIEMEQFKKLLHAVVELRDDCQSAIMSGGDQQSVVEQIDELFTYFGAVWLGTHRALGFSDLDQLCMLVKSELFSPNMTSESACNNVIDAFAPIESRLKQLDDAQDAKLCHANQLLEVQLPLAL
jgi:hypothetical protein